MLALRGVSLQVAEGSIVALLGANGAGKTTTLKAVSSLVRAERGHVGARRHPFSRREHRWRGRCRPGAPRHRAGAGGAAVLSRTSRWRRTSSPAASCIARRGAPWRPIWSASTGWFPRLKQRRKQSAGLNSGGEQQMIAIGRALMTRPRLVLLDEPSMGLAPMLVEEIFEIVRGLNQKEGVSFLIAEQNTGFALRYADHAFVLENGRVPVQGRAADLLRARAIWPRCIWAAPSRSIETPTRGSSDDTDRSPAGAPAQACATRNWRRGSARRSGASAPMPWSAKPAAGCRSTKWHGSRNSASAACVSRPRPAASAPSCRSCSTC